MVSILPEFVGAARPPFHLKLLAGFKVIDDSGRCVRGLKLTLN